MRIRPDRLTAYSAFAALAFGAAGTLFERADPSVLSAEPPEFASWAREHSDALLAQSALFSLGSAPLLVFFAGLRAVLHQNVSRREASRVDLSLVVLGGGALWVSLQLLGQAIQVSMASAAAHGEADAIVASLGDLMRVPLRWASLALGAALGTTAVVALRDEALPRWLGWLSAAAGGVQIVSAAVSPVGERSRSKDVLTYLPYPVFVAWMVSVAVRLLREGARSSIKRVPGWTNAGGGDIAPPTLRA